MSQVALFNQEYDYLDKASKTRPIVTIASVIVLNIFMWNTQNIFYFIMELRMYIV